MWEPQTIPLERHVSTPQGQVIETFRCKVPGLPVMGMSSSYRLRPCATSSTLGMKSGVHP